MTTLAMGGNIWLPLNYSKMTPLRWKLPVVALSAVGVAAWSLFLFLAIKNSQGVFYKDHTVAGSGIFSVNYDGLIFGFFVPLAIVSFAALSLALAYWVRIYNAKHQIPVGTINRFQMKFGAVALLAMAAVTAIGLHFAAEHPVASKPRLVSAIQSWGEGQGLDISKSEATKLANYSWDKGINSEYDATLVKRIITVDGKEVSVYATTPNRGYLTLEIFKEKK